MKSTVGHGPRAGRHPAALASIALALLLSGCATEEVQPEVEVPEGTEPLSGVELFKLYREKTWVWEDGAGRFYAERRRFLAWVSNEQGESYGEGHYILSDDGKLCMEATWTSAGGSSDARSCFLHRSDGETIYQKGRGDWYVFKHAETRPSDEYNKLIPADDVSEPYARIKAALSGE